MEAEANPLHAVARRLFPLVRSRPDWWRGAVRRWANNPPLHEVEPGTGEYLILPVPFDDFITTTDERVSLLAAIHDTYATADVRIDPWGPDAEVPQSDLAAFTAWGALCANRVPKLRQHWDTHEVAIQMFIAEVEREIAGCSSGTAAKAQRPRRKKAGYETVKHEAQIAADWVLAREAKRYKADFAEQKGLTVKELDKLLDRVAARKRLRTRK